MKNWGVFNFFKGLVFNNDEGYVGLSKLKNLEETSTKSQAKTKKIKKDVKISDLMRGNLSDY